MGAGREAEATSQKRFGLMTLTTLVIGNAIGAGVYTTSGFALADLGSRELVMAAWAVGGFIALCGAASYGMLARGLTESGGEYLYLSRSLHPLAGMIAGWISLIAGFTGAIAFAASAFEAYGKAAHPALASLPTDSLAIGSILFAGAIHLGRARIGAAVHNTVVSIMIISLIGLCTYAASLLVDGSWQVSSPGRHVADFQLGAFAGALVWISLSYSGFNAAVYVAGEAKTPKQYVPTAMVIGTTLTVILYLALNAVFLYVPEPSTIAGQAEIAAISAEALGGSALRHLVEAIIAVSLLTSVTAMVLAGPRVYAKMSEDGVFPGLFTMTAGSPPRAAILLQVGLACLVVVISDLQGLLSYLGFTLSISLALTVSTLFVRHIRLGERPHSLLYPAAPLLFITVTLFFAGISAMQDPVQLFAAAGTVLLGAAYYFAGRLKKD